jgi:hypothetical protein
VRKQFKQLSNAKERPSRELKQAVVATVNL